MAIGATAFGAMAVGLVMLMLAATNAAVDASSTSATPLSKYQVVWNVSLPIATAGPVNPTEAPTPNGLLTTTSYVYYDEQYNLNALNRSNGALLFSLPQYGQGLMQFVKKHNVVLLNSGANSSFDAIDATTGAGRWSIPQYYAVSPFLVSEDESSVTVYATDYDNDHVMLQVDIASGNVTWLYSPVLNTPLNCGGTGVTPALSDSFSSFVTYGVSLSNGSTVWANAEFWGIPVIGCLGTHAAVWNSAENQDNVISVFDTLTGRSLRNITVDPLFIQEYFDAFPVGGRYLCTQLIYSSGYAAMCYDSRTGNQTLLVNVTNTQAVYPLYDAKFGGELLAVVARNYATSGNVTVSAFDPATGKPVWVQRVQTPWLDDTYYQPGTTSAYGGRAVLLNDVEGFIVVDRDAAINVAGLGTTVRTDSVHVVPAAVSRGDEAIQTKDSVAPVDVFLVTKSNAFRLRLQ